MSDHNFRHALLARFSDAPENIPVVPGQTQIASMLTRGSCRTFRDTPIPDAVLELLCATALSAPSKSDLQQRDVVLMKSDGMRQKLSRLVADQTWVAQAPMIAIFCGNNRRHRLVHERHGIPFANDHLDAFFNAAADAAIALGAFVAATDAVGLGSCPISAVRNDAAAVSDLLGLPDHVFPFAGLAIGYPTHAPVISKRLPLSVTCHVDRYSEEGLQDKISAYDRDRAAAQPYAQQRVTETFGVSKSYCWSEDKARQYSKPERTTFGAFVRAKGFCLD